MTIIRGIGKAVFIVGFAFIAIGMMLWESLGSLGEKHKEA